MSKNLSFTFNNQTLKNLKKKWNKLMGRDVEEQDDKEKDVSDEDDETDSTSGTQRSSNEESESKKGSNSCNIGQIFNKERRVARVGNFLYLRD